MQKAVGIDLGTTFSSAAVSTNGKAVTILSDTGSNKTPSIVAFDCDQIFVGTKAEEIIQKQGVNVIYDSKRLIGRKFNDPEVQSDLKKWPFQVIKGKDGKPEITAVVNKETKSFSPEIISGIILKHIINYVNDKEGEIINAVITVPAYFTNDQRESTMLAAKYAGINCLRIINEPTAAALAYGMSTQKDCTFLVFDLGGGTFDVSILEKKGLEFKVLATKGDNHLGGADFDQVLMQYAINKLGDAYDPNNDYHCRLLKNECVLAKIRLSAMARTQIQIGTKFGHGDIPITRREFERLIQPLTEKCLETVQGCLERAGLNKENIEDVIMVGGSTRVPAIREAVRAFFGREPRAATNVDTVVAQGAAIYAETLLKDMLAGKSHPILPPIDDKKNDKENDKKNDKEKENDKENDSEIQKFTKDDGDDEEEDIVLVDVVPMSLGIQSASGKVIQVVPAGSPVGRAYRKESGKLTKDYVERGMKIIVLEGDSPRAKDNRVLARYYVKNISPENVDKKLVIVFEVDWSGVLTVRTELSNGVKSGTTVNLDSPNRSEEEVKGVADMVERLVCGSRGIEIAINAMADEVSSRVRKLKGEKRKLGRQVSSDLADWIDEHPTPTLEEIDEKRNELLKRLDEIE